MNLLNIKIMDSDLLPYYRGKINKPGDAGIDLTIIFSFSLSRRNET